ncbi:MAG: SPFH domain-containing protein [Anaerolineales bacterium]|jgi:hypothetical protein|nr:SPFH domain-containing protein [Anaerolineales bacterium]
MDWLTDFFMPFYWFLIGIPNAIMVGDRFWARLRFLGVIIVFFGFITLGGLIFEHDALDQTVINWLQVDPKLEVIPRFLLLLVAVLFTFESLRYAILPLAALVGALFWGAQYIQDIYELKSYRLALSYLVAALFGFDYPSLLIEDGKRQIKPGEDNLLDVIGGPGYVVIRPGNVVLFESLTNPSGVGTAGTYFVSRFQKIKEIADLRDQHDSIDRLATATKDGVVVSARDIHFSYRLRANPVNGGLAGRTPANPYPFSIQAVRNMTYNREVRNGTWASWRDMVKSIFEEEIQNYIRRHQVDQVTAPRNYEASAEGWQRGYPRLDIQTIYRSPRLQERFMDVGASLLWPEVGHLGVENSDVNDQRVTTWQVGWQGDAKRVLAYSEAKKQAYIEQGRAEAQAEILMSLTNAMQDLGNTPTQLGEKIEELFLLRLAQMLDAMYEENTRQAQSGQ